MVVLAIINLAVIPLLIGFAGATAWAGIAVAQSVGAIAALAVSFGWSTTGPTAIGLLDRSERGQYFMDSVASRWWLFLIVGPLMLLLTAAVAPGILSANLFASVTTILPAMAASWFFAGEQRGWRVFLLDTAPRALGTLAGAATLVVTGSLVVYTAVQAVGALVSVAVSYGDVARRHPGYSWNWGPRAAFARLGAQSGGMLTSMSTVFYGNVPLLVVSVLVPWATPAYAVADKLVKFGMSACMTLIQVAQGYVPGAGRANLGVRARRASRIALGLAALVAVGFALLAPWAASILSHGQIEVTLVLSVPLGLVLAAMAATGAVSTACLFPFGAVRVVATSAVAGAIAAVPVLPTLAVLAGAPGVAWGAAIIEVVVLAYQFTRLQHLIRATA